MAPTRSIFHAAFVDEIRKTASAGDFMAATKLADVYDELGSKMQSLALTPEERRVDMPGAAAKAGRMASSGAGGSSSRALAVASPKAKPAAPPNTPSNPMRFSVAESEALRSGSGDTAASRVAKLPKADMDWAARNQPPKRAPATASKPAAPGLGPVAGKSAPEAGTGWINPFA